MFYMSHNDIEGLFRDAAENYQVNSDKAFAWDKVDKAIRKSPGSNEPKKPGNKKRRFIFLLLLFFSAGLLSYNIWLIENQKHLLQKGADKNDVSTKYKKEQNITSIAQGNTATKSHDESLTTANNLSRESKKVSQSSITSINKPLLRNPTTKYNSTKDFLTNNKPLISDNSITNSDALNKTKEFLNAPLAFNSDKTEQKNIGDNALKKSDTTNASIQTTSDVNKKTGAKQEHGFYAGVTIAPDATFIKFQKTKGIGTSFGLTAGYRLNKKWSIETGVLLDTKRYYTKGEYFDKSKVTDLAYVDLLSVKGNCNMIEIPLNLRYNFATNNKHGWAAAVGTSSYFMSKEYYDYSVMSNGVNQTKEQTYHSSSKKIFAVINFSAGYEHQLNHALTLRIEPYFKIPVRGIGTGNLYMSSTGINIGVTKYFGKK